MSRSWDHGIRWISPERLAWLRGEREHAAPPWWSKGEEAWATFRADEIVRRRACKASRTCSADAEVVTSYRYVTGRAGRVSFAEREVCRDHGERFAGKHELAWPPEAAVVN